MNLPKGGEDDGSTLPDATPPAGLATNVAKAFHQTSPLHAQGITGNVASRGVSVGIAAFKYPAKSCGTVDGFCVGFWCFESFFMNRSGSKITKDCGFVRVVGHGFGIDCEFLNNLY